VPKNSVIEVVKSEKAQANGEIESVINTNTLKIVMGKPNENRLS
jgi:hypothetical protein